MAKKSVIRETYSTGTKWEEIAGFSRAIRVGNRILVAGTTATGPEGIVGKGNPAKQMSFILDRIEQAIEALGGKLSDVVRTRTYGLTESIAMHNALYFKI